MKKLILTILLVVSATLYGCDKNTDQQKPEPIELVETEKQVEKTKPQEAVRIPPDDELVKVTDYITDIAVDLKYATTDNFTGVVIYEDDTAYLRYGTVKKLSLVQEKLKEKGLCLKIWDAYRPPSAQFKLWEVCPNPAFVANPNRGYSGHSRGNTLDITVVDKSGAEVPMPSAFDEFGKKADRDYRDVSEEAGANSLLLEEIMTECGFEEYINEWWHYSDTDEYPVAKE